MDNFSKIIGYEKEKEELSRTADMLKNSEKYLKRGVTIPNTLLLYGVPGTGKTVMARAMIAESGLPSFDCKKDSPNGEFVSNIRKTFTEAVENAPSIVFLDDMDKFAEDNLDVNCNKEEFAVIQACLEDVKRKDVFVLATANDIDHLPRSLMRSGRFGRKMEINTPNLKDSELIIRKYLNGIVCEKDVDPNTLSLILCGKSCATIECIINEARILAEYDNSDVITKKHMVHSIMRVTKNLIETPMTNSELMKRVAYHEVGHAIVDYFNGSKISLVSILGYGNAKGICGVYDTPDYSFDRVKNRACALLGGKAAVKIAFDEEDMGVESDLETAMQEIREAIEKKCGDGFEYGYCLRGWNTKQAYGRMDRVTNRAYDIARECYEKALNTLKSNIGLLHKIANHLMECGFILGNEFEALAKEMV
jgi:cell division protease FtsH